MTIKMKPFRLEYVHCPPGSNMWINECHEIVEGRENAAIFDYEQVWMWDGRYKEHKLSEAEIMEHNGQPSLFPL